MTSRMRGFAPSFDGDRRPLPFPFAMPLRACCLPRNPVVGTHGVPEYLSVM